MAEIKNSFLSARMNKDVDDRILSNNEYRNALNLQVSKSEESDVGSLQTVSGNELVIDFNAITNNQNLDCIGYFVDTANNRVFLFLTDYNDTSVNGIYNKNAKNYIYQYNVSQNISSTNPKKLVEGSFLNFSKTNPIIGINLLEDLLFWTDNRNQPRKISVSKANPQGSSTPTYYVTEDQISVAKLSPVYAIELYAESTEAPGEYETTMYDVVNAELPDGTVNPYYNPDYIGDPAYLEDKFVRFSYRYKFDENEYSIFAPFTQVAYIPKQDGYFMYELNPDDPLLEPIVDDETSTYRSTIVSFMYNKVNNILLQIKLPCPANQLESLFKISEIEILYKESDGLAVQVVDIIPVSEIASQAGVSDVYVYDYQAKKPFKALPERDLTRVYDRTPVKALGQEIISNRVVYSNYQGRQGYPKFLNYNVACNDKSDFNLLTNRTSIIEYPNHTVKQNRNYQVGVVLSDKFGRQSGVILSNALESFDLSFGASSLYVPYTKETSPGSGIPDSPLVNQWPGYSLKILFNDIIGANGISDWPGIYDGDINSDNYNPLGWYSYKIVVKQTEQDYYNVYLPGVMAAYPNDATKELGKTSHVVLIGDNINKVPRDLNDISSSQEQYRSSVKLYARVNNIEEYWQNQQFYPNNTFCFVNTIATNSSLFSPPTPLPVGFDQFYQVDSNPLIARLTTDTKLGVTYIQDGEFNKTIRLAVYETEPFDSRLDIYWETTTSGIISELNQAIVENSDAPAFLENWMFNLNESFNIGDVVVEDFYFADVIGTPLTIPISNIQLIVKNLNGDDRTTCFDLVQSSSPDTFNIVTNDFFYHGFNANILESYVFYFNVSTFNPPTISEFQKQGSLQNVAPTITNAPTEPQFYPTGSLFLFQFTGINGSNSLGGVDQNDLTWSIVDFNYYSHFQIDPVTGELSAVYETLPEGIYLLKIRLTDANGLIDEIVIDIRISDLYGITWEVADGGPGIVSTGSEPNNIFISRGTIVVNDGFTARIRAGAFPFTWGPNDVNTLVTIQGFSPDLEAVGLDGQGSFSSLYHDLVGPGTWSFDIMVDYAFTYGGEGGMYIESI